MSSRPLGIQVGQGELLSQLCGVKLLGPDSEITISKSSLSLTLNTAIPNNMEELMAFSSSLSQSKFGKDPCWEPWDSSGDSRAAYAYVHRLAPQKAHQFSADLYFSAGGAAQDGNALTSGHGCWDLQLGKKPQVSSAWTCWWKPHLQLSYSHRGSRHFLPSVAAFTGPAVGCCSGISWTWQEHSYSSKASGGESCYYSSVKDFQLE